MNALVNDLHERPASCVLTETIPSCYLPAEIRVVVQAAIPRHRVACCLRDVCELFVTFEAPNP